MISDQQIEIAQAWLLARDIDDIEVVVPDLAGIARGKSMPCQKFIDVMRSGGLRVPETVFSLTINGDFIVNDYIQETDRDVLLIPDLGTLCPVPWQPKATALVICDAVYEDGTPVPFAPRTVLKSAINTYAQKGWKPIVAPEFEFYLLSHEEGIEGRPRPPIGASGRKSGINNPLSIDALDEFAAYFDDVYDCCEAQNIQVDTLIHEAGPAQFEFNVLHGEALAVADQSFLLKRLIRQVAIRHNLFASFMASPYSDTFGSAMHIHQSIEDMEDGSNIFQKSDGSDSALFLGYIAGLQQYLPNALPLLAPYVNSYRRFGSGWSSPTNIHWGRENRTVGLRVPGGAIENRRVENRIAGSDANPYLAIAGSLVCGYLGMAEKLQPSAAYTGSAYQDHDGSLPQHFLAGLDNFKGCEKLRQALSKEFVDTYCDVKQREYTSYSSVLSPWETKNLLFTV